MTSRKPFLAEGWARVSWFVNRKRLRPLVRRVVRQGDRFLSDPSPANGRRLLKVVMRWGATSATQVNASTDGFEVGMPTAEALLAAEARALEVFTRLDIGDEFDTEVVAHDFAGTLEGCRAALRDDDVSWRSFYEWHFDHVEMLRIAEAIWKVSAL